MPWLQLRIDSTRQQSAALEDALLSTGALSVTLEDNADQPILEPALGETPLWDNTRVTGLFEAGIDTAATASAIGRLTPLPAHRWEILEDKDWAREWMQQFQPIRFGERLWICPSWLEPPEPDAVNLLLDPGLAFGTGTHPTTALCLRWLDGLELSGKTVLDYGCGSGILGIAALLLGADQLIAVDNDPQALQATRDNAHRNSITADKLLCCLPDAVPTGLLADITVANILAGPLQQLAPQISAMTADGGLLALSGIISEQAATLGDCYGQWFSMQPPFSEQDWVRLTGIRTSA